MRIEPIALLAGALALSLAGVGCGGDPAGPQGRGPVARLWIGATGLVLGVGDTVTLRLRAGDRDNNVLHERPATPARSWPANLRVKWSSSDAGTVSVDSAGTVRGVRPGRAYVVAEAAGARDSGTVVVGAAGAVERGAHAAVAAGGAFTCALAVSERLLCWGSNWWGELAAGHRRRHTAYLSPTAAAGPLSFIAVAVGSTHACGLGADGGPYCWGDAADGKLGDPAVDWMTGQASPVRVAGGLRLQQIAAGPTHTCGLDREGVAHCWGSNRYGQLGDGAAGASRAQPRAAKTDLRFVRLALGLDHTCGLVATGRAYCWGSNALGQLGVGAATSRSVTPVPVAGQLAFTRLDAGAQHSCALTPEGRAYCWGRNWYGQLGTGAASGTTGAEFAPAAVAGGLAFGDVSAGLDHTCAVAVDGAAYCWGHNWRGQLGTGFDFAARNYTAVDLVVGAPARVAGDLRFTAVSAGASHTCGLTASGDAYCWGENTAGQLGTGGLARVPGLQLTLHASPVRVAPPL